MKKLLIAFLLVILPSFCFAQSTLENPAVGTCKQITSDGYWQKLSDFSWAPPSDKLNSCASNGFLNSTLLGYNNLPSQYQYNSTLGQMTAQQWFTNCVLMSSILPLAQCQGYNPYLYGINGQSNYFGSLLNYPQFGRDYIAITNPNSSIYVDLSSSQNKWRDALIGVGMGWLLNRLTS